MASTDTAHDATAEAHDDHHPTPGDYVRIGILLAVLTAFEVSLFYIALTDVVRVTSMIVLMVTKFAIVVAYYMHLKFDTRIYTRLMVTGLVLAATIYAVVLVTFGNVLRPGG